MAWPHGWRQIICASSRLPPVTLKATHTGASLQSADTAQSGSFDITAGAPGHLVISKQPTNTAAGDDIGIAVTAVDNFGNTLLATPITVTLDAAVNPAGWPLLTSSSLSKITVNGVATWGAADHLRINKAINGYRLAASGLGEPVVSQSFNMIPASPSALRFVQQPTSVAQNASLNPAVSVGIFDAFGNQTTTNAVDVSLTLSTAPCGGALSNSTASSSGGAAVFNNLSLNTICAGNVLTASAPGLIGATSDTFEVTRASASGGNNGNGDNNGNGGNGGDTGGDQTGNGPRNICGLGTAAAMLPLMLLLTALRQRIGRPRRRAARARQ